MAGLVMPSIRVLGGDRRGERGGGGKLKERLTDVVTKDLAVALGAALAEAFAAFSTCKSGCQYRTGEGEGEGSA